MIKAVIFDLDDTLISEKEYILSGYKVVSQYIEKVYRLNATKVYNTLLELFEKNKKNVFNRLLELFEIKYSDKEIFELVNVYRTHTPKIKFYYDIEAILKELKKKDIKTGIISDGYAETQRRKIEAVNAKKIFNNIILTDELGRCFWKPNVKAFEIMKEKLDVNFEEMMYIGDNPEKDFYIRKIYPIKTVRICRQNSIYKNAKYLEGIREEYSIKKMEEILELM